MSKLIDESIRLAGRPVEIIRSNGNLTSYMWAYSTGYLAGKRKQEPVFQHEAGAMFPSDSDIVAGDLVHDYMNYFLVVSLSQDYHYGESYGFRAMLYKCNATVSIMEFNDTTNKHDTLVQSGVHCLITQVQAMAWDEDEVFAMRQYRGREQPFQVYMRSNEGLTNTCILIDSSNRHFRISKEFDVFVSDNIIQTEVLWES